MKENLRIEYWIINDLEAIKIEFDRIWMGPFYGRGRDAGDSGRE